MDHKGQMTTFMILGVVIILFSSLGFYLYREATMSSFENKVDNVAQQMKINALDNYIESCLRSALMEKLDSVALRGGFLGEIPEEFMSRGVVSVAIPDFDDYGNDEYLRTPKYPNTFTKGIKQEFHIDPLTPYPFGGRSLKKLCQIGGPNDAPLHIFARPCPRGSYGPDSIQRDLNLHVKTALESCVDPEYMNEITGYEIGVGTPIVSIVFGEEDVRAEAEYPINITLEDGAAVRTFDFAAEVPVRIKKVYGLAQHIINNDRSYVTFNKKDTESLEWRSEFWDSAMTVDVVCPNCPEDPTDVVTITDAHSDLDGRYLLFKFAIRNRIPVLEPMRGPSATGEGEEEFHFDVTDGATIDIQPIAIDPDEDELHIYYRGWMIDPTTCILNPEGGERTTNCDRTITANDALFDRPRTGSSPDYGMLTVIVCDVEINPDTLIERQEHCDWQEVSIRLSGSATLENEVGCYYDDDVDTDDCVSLEDPFILTTPGAPGTFTWTSDEIPKTFTDTPSLTTFPDAVFEDYIPFFTAEFSSLCFPLNNPNCESTASLANIRRNKILWIKKFMERYVFGEIVWPPRGTSPVTKSWTLNSGDMIERFDIDVSRCIPYENPDSPYPYPYNLPGDPFKATHTCCTSTGTIKGPDAECYSDTTYGPPIFADLPDGAYDRKANDVYAKEVTHKCDGVRGNICTTDGYKTEEISDEPLGRPCADFVIPGQVERCEGPSVTTRPGTDILTYECKQYEPGGSFEFEFGLAKKGMPLISANGNCGGAPNFAVREGAGMYNPTASTGPFLCEGQCNAGSCDFAAECVCDSTGRVGDEACNGLTYSALHASGGRGVAASGKLCDINCQVVGPDISAPACRAAIESLGGTWESRAYSASRSGSERCCGDRVGEFLPFSSGTRCCSVSDSCVIGSECVAPGTTTPDGRYFCDGGISKLCTITQECSESSGMWCNGEQWETSPAGDLEGRSCGRGALCAECRFVPTRGKTECVGASENCRGSSVCRLIGLNFQCTAS